jgi:hypothetical protein
MDLVSRSRLPAIDFKENLKMEESDKITQRVESRTKAEGMLKKCQLS